MAEYILGGQGKVEPAFQLNFQNQQTLTHDTTINVGLDPKVELTPTSHLTWKDMFKKAIVEFCITFVFTTVFCILFYDPNPEKYAIYVSLLYGALLFFAYYICRNAFINPWFVFGTWVLKQNNMLGFEEGVWYHNLEMFTTAIPAIAIIIGQFLGAFLGCLFTIPLVFSYPIAPEFPTMDYWQGFLAEAVGMFVLSIVFFSMTDLRRGVAKKKLVGNSIIYVKRIPKEFFIVMTVVRLVIAVALVEVSKSVFHSGIAVVTNLTVFFWELIFNGIFDPMPLFNGFLYLAAQCVGVLAAMVVFYVFRFAEDEDTYEKKKQ